MVRVRQKTLIWHLIPLAGRNRFCTTIGSTIYLSPKRFNDYKQLQPKVSTTALVEHEKVHVAQYEREGLMFCLKYLFSRKWRLRYEAEAYAKQIFVRLQLGSRRSNHYYIDRYAALIKSNYLLGKSHQEIYEAIEREHEKWTKESLAS